MPVANICVGGRRDERLTRLNDRPPQAMSVLPTVSGPPQLVRVGLRSASLRKSHSEHFSTAVTQKADVVLSAANGSFVPQADMATADNIGRE